jgi:hypothetical protein
MAWIVEEYEADVAMRRDDLEAFIDRPVKAG